jgi:biopolymer transport protein ExbD/biopolymer transport protein TolR
MAFDLTIGQGKRGRARPEMNVTPLVDVVLVLLIIFMVLTAAMTHTFWLNVPEKPKTAELQEPENDGDQPIVVSVNQRGRIQINSDEYPDQDFAARLRRVLVARGERRVYFDAHDQVPFERAVQVLDMARGSGAAHIAVVTEKLE